MKYLRIILSFSLILLIMQLSCSTTSYNPLPYRGTNLDGAQFGTVYPGTEGVDYSFPTTKDVDYFASKNMTTFRIGFQWERMQPSLKGEFNQTYFDKLNALVTYATSKNMFVLLNPHNYARYKTNNVTSIVGSPEVPNDAFADFWRRMSEKFKNNPKVFFSLVNEPNTMPTMQWVNAANAAILAIRSTGNNTLISVPGNAWTGANQWSSNWGPDSGYDVSNATAMLNIKDPANNYVFEVHNYFDDDGSGNFKNNDCVNENIGITKIQNVTTWAKTNKKKVIVGEFSGINTPTCQKAVSNFITYLSNNPDVYVGWLWWSAGTPWGNYRLSINPVNNVDEPRMTWLIPFLPKIQPVEASVDVQVVPKYLSTTYDSNGFFKLNSGQSEYIGYKPDTYKDSTPISLFVWMHGCGGNAQGDLWTVAPSTTRSKQSYIVISLGGRDGACWKVNEDTPKVLAAIEHIKLYFNINPNKVYLGGYSSGGDMTYRVGMQNAKLFAGLLVENSDILGAGVAQSTLMTQASWKINIVQLNHLSDTTYPIAKVRTNLAALKAAGFPVVAIEKPGNHYDPSTDSFGTNYDLIKYVLPYLDVNWQSPMQLSDAGIDASFDSSLDSGKDSSDSSKDSSVDASDASKDGSVVLDSGVDSGDAPIPSLKLMIRITHNWGSGYCEEVDIYNKTNITLSWTEFKLNMRDGKIRDTANKGVPWDTWTSTFSARTGVITVKPTWNKTVAPNSKVLGGGFCADFSTGTQKWTATYVEGSLK